jgi:hypothetical protein
MSTIQQLPQEVFDTIVSKLTNWEEVCNLLEATNRVCYRSKHFKPSSFLLNSFKKEYTRLYDAYSVYAEIEFNVHVHHKCNECNKFQCEKVAKFVRRQRLISGCYACKGAGCEDCDDNLKQFTHHRIFKYNGRLYRIKMNLKKIKCQVQHNNMSDLTTKIARYLVDTTLVNKWNYNYIHNIYLHKYYYYILKT